MNARKGRCILRLNTVLLGAVLAFGAGATPGYADVKRYNGDASGDDRASATTVDRDGNIYVTGRSMGAGTGYDFATVKYSPLGVQLWVARYNGPDNSDELPSAIAVDANGCVYVTGSSRRHSNGRSDLDYLTVRYTTTFLPPDRWGQVRQVPHLDWVKRYDGAGGDDVAVGVALYSGKVFVTGYSRGGLVAQYDPRFDYATLAYDAVTGNPQWGPARFDNGSDDKAVAIAAASDHIYVTGWAIHNGQYDVVTLRYNLDGTHMVLMQRNNGWPTALRAVGGFLYVAGGSGQPLPGNNTDYLVIKYDLALNEQWHDTFDVFGQRDYGTALAIDSNGNVFVTGICTGNRGELNTDIFTLKWGPDGTRLTFWFYDGTPGSDGPDASTAIEIDSANNVYVTGYSVADAARGLDYVTLRLNNAGMLYVWAERWTSAGRAPLANADYPTAMAIDGAGNVIVTGYAPAEAQANDFVTIKYTPAGIIFAW